MYLARIDGTLTSTIKHETLGGFRFLIAQRLEGDGSDSGEPQVLQKTRSPFPELYLPRPAVECFTARCAVSTKPHAACAVPENFRQ